MTGTALRTVLALVVLAGPVLAVDVRAEGDAKDWPTYNRDFLGSRFNRGETSLSRENAGQLEEKWRFPVAGSGEAIGVIHATPIVVNGYVYFGTTTANPTFYKLGPVWSGPSVSRGRVYVGTGNTQFTPTEYEAFLPKKYTGVLFSFGLPGEDEVSRLGAGKE